MNQRSNRDIVGVTGMVIFGLLMMGSIMYSAALAIGFALMAFVFAMIIPDPRE